MKKCFLQKKQKKNKTKIFNNEAINKIPIPEKKDKKVSRSNLKILNNNNNITHINRINNFNRINNNPNNLSNYKKILNYNDNELNTLEYKEAIISDKRTFFQFYLSLLKEGNLFVFAFYCNNNDYNSQIIKIFLFFFFFSVHFTINALFFNDDTMHKIYLDEGSFNFVYQILQIIYSSLISAAISILIIYLSLSQSNILEMKKEKNMEKLNIKVKELIKCLKIKFALFFVVSFFLLIFFAYYIICFCGIYVNTQLHLIKDTLISFGLSLIYPFGLCLIPGFFRIPALKAKNKDKECLYKFSKIIQTLCA